MFKRLCTSNRGLGSSNSIAGLAGVAGVEAGTDRMERPVTVDFLLSKGAEKSCRNGRDMTALHYALPNVSGARPLGRQSLDGAAKKAGYDSGEERATIAVKLLRHNLDHHEGEDRLGQNYDGGTLGGKVDDEKALVAKPNSYETSPPPNGGTRAWLQVVGMFFICLNTAGITSSFGLYQTFYVESFGLKATQACLIGSAQSFLILFSSLVGGPLYDSGRYRVLLIVGSLLAIGGTFLQSISTTFVQLFLTQGVMVGLGGGLFGFLGPSILSTYFTTRLPLASGIGMLSGGVVGIMYPILFRFLQPAIGYGWTVRVFGIIVAVSLGIVFLTLKQRRPPAAKRAFFDPTAFTDWPYLTFVAGNFMVNLGLYAPFIFASTFALEKKLADETLALYLVAILNVGSLFGRVIPSMLASRFSGPFNMNVFVTIMTSVLALALLGCSHSLAALLVVLVLYGFSMGAFFALQPVTLISLCPDESRIGSRVGMASAALAFGALPASTVASIILQAVGFNGVWLWAGATTGLGALLMASSRLQKTGMNLWVVI